MYSTFLGKNYCLSKLLKPLKHTCQTENEVENITIIQPNKINLIKLLTTEGNSIPDAKNKINNMIQTKISALATSSEDNFYTEFLLNLAKKVEAFYQLYCFEHFAKNQNLT